MHHVYKAGLASFALIVILNLTACAPKTQTLRDDSILADTSGLELDESEAPTELYIRPGAPGLGEYDRFIIDLINIHYDDPNMQELTPEQANRMKVYLSNVMYEELTDAGYEVGTRSEPDTLRISFTLSGLRAPSAGANVSAAVVPFAISVGEVTVEAVIRDGLSNQIEAVVVTRVRGSRFLNPSPWSTWADIEKFFDSWAKGFREAVDEAHGR